MSTPLYTAATIKGIHFEPTDKCNAGCPMCPRYINYGSQLNPFVQNADITVEQFKSWFPPEFISQLNQMFSCGNYGDPTVSKDILKIYQYIREHNQNMSLRLHTNGSTRTTAWWESMAATMNVEHRNDYAVFSVDGLADTNHLYRQNTNFDKIMANAQAFIDAGGIAHWDFIVFKHNEHQVDEAKELARKMGFEFFNIKKTSRWAQRHDGMGYYPVHNKRGDLTHVLEQPDNPDYCDKSDEIKKQVFNLSSKSEPSKPRHISPSVNVAPVTFMPSSKVRKVDTNPENALFNANAVACRAQSRERGGVNHVDEIFISASGHVFPCCFLGGEPWKFTYQEDDRRSGDQFMYMVELNGGMDSISLHHHSLEDILNSKLYAEMIVESFESSHPNRSLQCSTCCGKDWNKIGFGELGDKTDKNGVLK